MQSLFIAAIGLTSSIAAMQQAPVPSNVFLDPEVIAHFHRRGFETGLFDPLQMTFIDASEANGNEVLGLSTKQVIRQSLHDPGVPFALELVDEGTCSDLRELVELKSLKALSIRSPNARALANNEQLDVVTRIVSLRGLSIDAEPLTDKSASLIARLTNLETLDLRNSTVTEDAMLKLRDLRRLKHLNLAGSKRINGRALGILSASLNHLDLSETSVTDEYLMELCSLNNLRTLKLRNTNVGDDGIGHLTKLAKLEELDLFATQITDRGLKTLSTMKSLRLLNAPRTRISNEAIRRFTKSLPSCEFYP